MIDSLCKFKKEALKSEVETLCAWADLTEWAASLRVIDQKAALFCGSQMSASVVDLPGTI